VTRRRSCTSASVQRQRQAARTNTGAIRAQAAARREADRARAAYLRAVVAEEKERKRLYTESRAAEVAAMNEELEANVKTLQGILAAALRMADRISFSSLKLPASVPPWGRADLERAEPAPVHEEFMLPARAGLSKAFGRGRHEQAVAEGRGRYEQAVQAHRCGDEQRSLRSRRHPVQGRGSPLLTVAPVSPYPYSHTSPDPVQSGPPGAASCEMMAGCL
jgi:restriction system protein